MPRQSMAARQFRRCQAEAGPLTAILRIRDAIERIPDFAIHGRVSGVIGLTVEASGFAGTIAVADECSIAAGDGTRIRGEVIALKPGKVLIMPHGAVDGLGLGCRVVPAGGQASMAPDRSWRGRVLNAFGEPVDGGGPLQLGPIRYGLRRRPPQAHARSRIGSKLDVGVRALNAFLTCCEGQRLGIFAGSGVGKSSLLSMIARNTAADVVVIGLIGERGREAREFIEDDLGADGLARSVVVVATSDEAPAVRRRAALATMTVAEAFRDQGATVLCLMDSLTRFAMAQREIGLAAGEPPTTKGYTPSVFALLPQLLERAGPGECGQGSITAFFTVLVDGDDHNEPIADAVRGILDGHIVLERAIAERGRYPAINILRSISRTMPGCNTAAENAIVGEARRVLAVYEDMAELIRLGAYKRGSDPQVDRAIELYPRLESFFGQAKDEAGALADAYAALKAAITA